MKILALFTLLASTAVTPLAASAQTAPPAAAASAQAPPEVVAALEKLNSEWLTAYKTRDGAALDRILADDFEAIYPGGRILRKADLIKTATNPARTVSDIGWDDLKILVFGDVAVVRARSRIVGKTAEGDFSGRNDYADVYVRRAGAWRAVSAHVVPVTD
ncbi:nuclear transport factor 2 family protein [Caulobacter sp. BE254]|uniref:nuclear transport factor 2 family protein n=1 Tax=Caulobacter sp. BE254 TaxID=2817720 RepID=UPI00285A6292|nr:nuclear transport factor 2 family protein [Caulobacter sp. BE254]MDR7114552.1 ketosteroid isomerase-like protein [Caulobacter sp. BE254]